MHKYIKYEVIALIPISPRDDNMEQKFQPFNYGYEISSSGLTFLVLYDGPFFRVKHSKFFF